MKFSYEQANVTFTSVQRLLHRTTRYQKLHAFKVDIRCVCFPFQQSQLSHYPERKIAEFQLKIEALEREYKSFIAKLRVFDPSCKNKPWSPRGYCKRRAETQDSPSIGQCKEPKQRHSLHKDTLTSKPAIPVYLAWISNQGLIKVAAKI